MARANYALFTYGTFLSVKFLFFVPIIINFIRFFFFSLTRLLNPASNSIVYICRVFWWCKHYFTLSCWCLVTTIWALIIVLPLLFRPKRLSIHVFTCSLYLDYVAMHRNVHSNELSWFMTGCSLSLCSEESCTIVMLDLEILELFSDHFRLLYKLILLI